MGKGFLGQQFPGMEIDVPFFFQHVDQVFIPVRIGDDHHIMEVLGGSPDHGRTADVDVLDGFGFRHIRFGNGFLERVQVHHHQVDGLDPVFLHVFHVFGVATHRQDAPVDLGIQGLHPAVHHFRSPGHVTHISHRHAGFLQYFHGAAGGNNLYSIVAEEIAQLHNARFIGNTQ